MPSPHTTRQIIAHADQLAARFETGPNPQPGRQGHAMTRPTTRVSEGVIRFAATQLGLDVARIANFSVGDAEGGKVLFLMAYDADWNCLGHIDLGIADVITRPVGVAS